MKSNYICRCTGHKRAGRLSVPGRGGEALWWVCMRCFELCKSRAANNSNNNSECNRGSSSRGSDAERDRRQPPPHSRPPPTVQQAVNSDISVNKHFGPNPFRGPKVWHVTRGVGNAFMGQWMGGWVPRHRQSTPGQSRAVQGSAGDVII